MIERPIDQFVSGPEGMAGRHDPRGVLLSIGGSISSGRTVRANLPDQARLSVHSGEYRRGHGRENTGSFVQSLRISQGSLKELETHLLLAERVGIVDQVDLEAVLSRCESLGKMLRALIRSLQDRSAK